MYNDGLKALDEMMLFYSDISQMMLFYSDNSKMMFLNHRVQ